VRERDPHAIEIARAPAGGIQQSRGRIRVARREAAQQKPNGLSARRDLDIKDFGPHSRIYRARNTSVPN